MSNTLSREEYITTSKGDAAFLASKGFLYKVRVEKKRYLKILFIFQDIDGIIPDLLNEFGKNSKEARLLFEYNNVNRIVREEYQKDRDARLLKKQSYESHRRQGNTRPIEGERLDVRGPGRGGEAIKDRGIGGEAEG